MKNKRYVGVFNHHYDINREDIVQGYTLTDENGQIIFHNLKDVEHIIECRMSNEEFKEVTVYELKPIEIIKSSKIKIKKIKKIN